jgi:hypothetical protein
MVELEKEKVQQNSRMEQLMAALLKQMGGDPPPQGQTINAEMTPVVEVQGSLDNEKRLRSELLREY